MRGSERGWSIRPPEPKVANTTRGCMYVEANLERASQLLSAHEPDSARQRKARRAVPTRCILTTTMQLSKKKTERFRTNLESEKDITNDTRWNHTYGTSGCLLPCFQFEKEKSSNSSGRVPSVRAGYIDKGAFQKLDRRHVK